MSAPQQPSDQFLRQVAALLVTNFDPEDNYPHVKELKAVMSWMAPDQQQQVLRSSPDGAATIFPETRIELTECERFLERQGFLFDEVTSMIQGNVMAWISLIKNAATRHLVKWRTQPDTGYARYLPRKHLAEEQAPGPTSTQKSALTPAQAQAILNFGPISAQSQPQPASAPTTAKPEAMPEPSTSRVYHHPITTVLSIMSNATTTSPKVLVDDKGKKPEVTVAEVVPSADEAPASATTKKKRKKKTTTQKAGSTALVTPVAAATQHDTATEPVASFLCPGPVHRRTPMAHHHCHIAQTAVLHDADDDCEENDHDDNNEPAAVHENDHDAEAKAEDTSTPHSHECTCTSSLPCTAKSSSTPYSTAYFEQWRALYPSAQKSMPTILKAANLKLRADHAHNTWYRLIIVVRACKCPSCCDVTFDFINKLGNTAHNFESYGTLVKPAREEYKKLEDQFDKLVVGKRTVIFKEWMTTEDVKGWPKAEVLSERQIRGMLPDGRDASLDIAANPNIDFEDVMARFKLGDARREARKAQLGLGG